MAKKQTLRGWESLATPVDETPVNETPVDETPVDATPVETPVETPVATPYEIWINLARQIRPRAQMDQTIALQAVTAWTRMVDEPDAVLRAVSVRAKADGYDNEIDSLLRACRQLYKLSKAAGVVESPTIGALALASGLLPITIQKWMNDALRAHKRVHPNGAHPLAIPQALWRADGFGVKPQAGRGETKGPREHIVADDIGDDMFDI